MGLRGLRLSKPAQAALLAHDWPGNVRELEYLIARSALKAMGRQARAGQAAGHGIVSLEAIDLDIATGLASTAPPTNGVAVAPPDASSGELRSRVDAYKRSLIDEALATHRGNVAGAARQLGLDRGNLVRLARRLGLELARTATTP